MVQGPCRTWVSVPKLVVFVALVLWVLTGVDGSVIVAGADFGVSCSCWCWGLVLVVIVLLLMFLFVLVLVFVEGDVVEYNIIGEKFDCFYLALNFTVCTHRHIKGKSTDI